MKHPGGIGAGEPAKRAGEGATWMEPTRYVGTFFRTAACLINYIRLLSGRHFEARKFCLELRKALADPPAESPRRA